MNKDEIIKILSDYDRVKDFLADIVVDHILSVQLTDYREGKETIEIVSIGRCQENNYDEYNLNELLTK
jgi:hypothetical protein